MPIKIEGNFGNVQLRLQALVRANTDFTPLMGSIGELLHGVVQENFDQEGRPRWQPLAASTIEQREREGKWPGKILQRSGRLASSFSTAHDSMSATVGTNSEYAGTQQEGAKKGQYGKTARGAPIPWGDIPARDMFALTDDDRGALLELVTDYETRTAEGG